MSSHQSPDRPEPRKSGIHDADLDGLAIRRPTPGEPSSAGRRRWLWRCSGGRVACGLRRWCAAASRCGGAAPRQREPERSPEPSPAGGPHGDLLPQRRSGWARAQGPWPSCPHERARAPVQVQACPRRPAKVPCRRRRWCPWERGCLPAARSSPASPPCAWIGWGSTPKISSGFDARLRDPMAWCS